jgi:hypothetical protein
MHSFVFEVGQKFFLVKIGVYIYHFVHLKNLISTVQIILFFLIFIFICKRRDRIDSHLNFLTLK